MHCNGLASSDFSILHSAVFTLIYSSGTWDTATSNKHNCALILPFKAKVTSDEIQVPNGHHKIAMSPWKYFEPFYLGCNICIGVWVVCFVCSKIKPDWNSCEDNRECQSANST
jgi:hypothetical protein